MIRKIKSGRMFFVNRIISMLPDTRCHQLKSSLLRFAGVNVGRNLEYCSSARILGGGMELIIGDNCFIGHQALLFGASGSRITIEDYAKVASRATIVTGSHIDSLDGPCIRGEGTFADVRICSGAVVSAGSTVLPGVTVNRMAHVAAGAVVTKDVPEFCRVGGVPAKVIRDFRMEDKK